MTKKSVVPIPGNLYKVHFQVGLYEKDFDNTLFFFKSNGISNQIKIGFDEIIMYIERIEPMHKVLFNNMVGWVVSQTIFKEI